MIKGVLIGLGAAVLMAAVGVGSAWAYLNVADRTVPSEGKAAQAPVNLDDIHPASVTLESDAEYPGDASRYYARLFVSADLGDREQYPSFTISEYETTLEHVAEMYPGNTMIQIGEGIETIYRARSYWPDLTYLRCMGYLTDGVPATLVATTDKFGTTTFDTTRTVGSGMGKEGASNAAQERYSGTVNSSSQERMVQSVTQSDVMADCDEIYGWLEYEFYRPQYEALQADAARQQALHNTIRQNQESARIRAQQEMAAKAEERRQQIEGMYRQGQRTAEVGQRHQEQVRLRRLRDGY